MMENFNGEIMEEEARSKTRNAGREDEQVSVSHPGIERRKLLGWIGFGIVGVLALNKLPFRLFPRRIGSMKKQKSRGPRISINEMAVRRTKKVGRNV